MAVHPDDPRYPQRREFLRVTRVGEVREVSRTVEGAKGTGKKIARRDARFVFVFRFSSSGADAPRTCLCPLSLWYPFLRFFLNASFFASLKCSSTTACTAAVWRCFHSS